MPKLFIVSSIGDSDLALATAVRLPQDELIYFLPLTEVAASRTASFLQDNVTHLLSPEDLKNISLSTEHVSSFKQLIADKKIDKAFIGVPSPLNETLAYEFAEVMEIPCILAYEYLFNAPEHQFWYYLDKMAANSNLQFAVPTDKAKAAVIAKSAQADGKVSVVGHLSIDKVHGIGTPAAMNTKEKLKITAEQGFAFISGTTQPAEADCDFVEALLEELRTGNYPDMQLRFGIHPGVFKRDDYDNYIKSLVNVCDSFPETTTQFKIVLTDKAVEHLTDKSLADAPCFMRVNVSGPEMEQAADRVAQAVPGALPNQAALQGKGAYYHQAVESYLSTGIFAESLTAFFSRPVQKDVGSKVAELLIKV